MTAENLNTAAFNDLADHVTPFAWTYAGGNPGAVYLVLYSSGVLRFSLTPTEATRAVEWRFPADIRGNVLHQLLTATETLELMARVQAGICDEPAGRVTPPWDAAAAYDAVTTLLRGLEGSSQFAALEAA